MPIKLDTTCIKKKPKRSDSKRWPQAGYVGHLLIPKDSLGTRVDKYNIVLQELSEWSHSCTKSTVGCLPLIKRMYIKYDMYIWQNQNFLDGGLMDDHCP